MADEDSNVADDVPEGCCSVLVASIFELLTGTELDAVAVAVRVSEEMVALELQLLGLGKGLELDSELTAADDVISSPCEELLVVVELVTV